MCKKNSWVTSNFNYSQQTQGLTRVTSDGGSVVVPGQGLVIFGGNDLPNSLKLAHINEVWANGPDLPGRIPMTGPCVVQVFLFNYDALLCWDQNK